MCIMIWIINWSGVRIKSIQEKVWNVRVYFRVIFPDPVISDSLFVYIYSALCVFCNESDFSVLTVKVRNQLPRGETKEEQISKNCKISIFNFQNHIPFPIFLYFLSFPFVSLFRSKFPL